ncbi:hypothetical protein HYR54_17510 [Candidatus Acetothermia bacterium]|nr:hypothetical protein [Candidatus Acetothermia bacterium]
MNSRGSGFFKSGLVRGAIAGLFGGLVFGLALYKLGALPTIAGLVGTDDGKVGMVVHMIVAAIIGAGFGAFVWHQRAGIGETIFWGLTYGVLWWFLGPLTLMPLWLKGMLAWDIPAAQAAFPSLIGHLFYGVSTALAFVLLQPERRGAKPSVGALLRGALAGLLGAWWLGDMLNAQGQLRTLWTTVAAQSNLVAWMGLLLIGLLAGMAFALLYPRATDSSGASLIRGIVYGFIWWVVGALTLLPSLGGGGWAWSVEEVRASFGFFPGFLLFGVTLALSYHWLSVIVRVLFSDELVPRGEEGIGAEGLRALGRGALAGLFGGLVFTLVMIQIGFLSTVASLIGSTSSLAGLMVHLVIANLVGSSYGLLFRRQAYDIGSALGWGVSYGFFWWILGPLTLMPILLGTTPVWTVQVAASLLPGLIGHLAYGAVLGIVFYLMEARYNPWWIPHEHVDALRVERRKEQVLTSAPALWVFVVAIALIVPIVLGK